MTAIASNFVHLSIKLCLFVQSSNEFFTEQIAVVSGGEQQRITQNVGEFGSNVAHDVRLAHFSDVGKKHVPTIEWPFSLATQRHHPPAGNTTNKWAAQIRLLIPSAGIEAAFPKNLTTLACRRNLQCYEATYVPSKGPTQGPSTQILPRTMICTTAWWVPLVSTRCHSWSNHGAHEP